LVEALDGVVDYDDLCSVLRRRKSAKLKETTQVAKNTGEGSRKGAVKERVQALNPVTKRYVKIDTSTGRIVDHKKTAGPYKGIREAQSSRPQK
jgi:hypothetical protein